MNDGGVGLITKAAVAVSVCALSVAIGVPTQAQAPPLELAFQAVGEGAEERRDDDWTLTVTDGGVQTLCDVQRDGETAAFRGDAQTIELSGQASWPWRLVWAVVWASEPGEVLEQFDDDWGAETARVDTVDGELVYCYGGESRLCVDEQLRTIAAVDVEVDGTRLKLESSADGTRLQVIEDGSPVARLSVDGRC